MDFNFIVHILLFLYFLGPTRFIIDISVKHRSEIGPNKSDFKSARPSLGCVVCSSSFVLV